MESLVSFRCMIVLMMLPALTRGAPVVTGFNPKSVIPGQQVLVHGMGFDQDPVQIQFGTVHAKIIHKSASTILAEVPYAAGKAPVRVSNRYGTFETKETISITKAMGFRYPKDRTLQFPAKSAMPLLLSPTVNAISPFAQNTKYLIMVGCPTDIAMQFTFGDLERDIKDRFATVRSYWSTMSQGGMSLADGTVYPKVIPLQKRYSEYIYDPKYPIARGSVVSLTSNGEIDFRGITDPTVSVTVTGPSDTTYTIIATLPPGDYVSLTQLFYAFLEKDIFTYYVSAGTNQVAIDVEPTSDGTTSFLGDGYAISSLDGPAWAPLGLASSPQLFPGSGVDSPSNGFDRNIDPSWEDEIYDAVNDDTSFDGSQYDGLIYMLVDAPALKGWFIDGPYGALDFRWFRATAMVGYGWMRLNHDADWETWAHETGHNLGFDDQYSTDISLPGQAVDAWTLMGDHWLGPHISGWEKGDAVAETSWAGWLPGSSILSATPPGPGGATATSRFVLAPQYDPVPTNIWNTDPIGYVARIPLAANHEIVVEGRQDQPPTTPPRFDEYIDQLETVDLDPVDKKGGVVIYDIRKSLDPDVAPNVWRRQMLLLSPYHDALDPSERYDDPTLGVKVSVLGAFGTGNTRSFDVQIDWGRVNPPLGQLFDAYITPWDSHYQSPDIWVDSPANGYDVYESTGRTANNDPDGAGDRPWVMHDNRLYARIHNSGPQAIPSATTTFWVATPGIGGDWQRLGDSVPVGPIPAGGSVVAQTIWVPAVSGHACVKVEVVPLEGEMDFANNMAQENFTDFEASSSSPYEPLAFSFTLSNPFNETRQFSVRAKRLAPGVSLSLDHAFPVLKGGDHVVIGGTVSLDKDIPPSRKYDSIVPIAAYFTEQDSERELGGITLNVQPRRATTMKAEFKIVDDGVNASGSVTGGSMPRRVTVALVVNGMRRYVWFQTSNDGSFAAHIPMKVWSSVTSLAACAFIPAQGDYSSAEIEEVHLKLRPPELQAYNPVPADGDRAVSTPLLQWTAGETAVLHNVYLGTSPDLGPADLASSRTPMTIYYHTAGLRPGVTYYWRVDEIEKDGTTVHVGTVWSFTTQALTAYYPSPVDGATDASPTPILTWQPGQMAIKHHVYFSSSLDAIEQRAAWADKGEAKIASFTPATLAAVTTYFWAVDELIVGGDTKTGPVWTFTTCLPVDDFESYTNAEGPRIFETWMDGSTNDTGSVVGYVQAPFAERTIVHSGQQSMPLEYNNVETPYYSEAQRTFDTPQDWTAGNVSTLILSVRGQLSNSQAQLYLAVGDTSNRTATVIYPDTTVVGLAKWTEWKISLSGLTGVNIARIKKITVGLGDRTNPKLGGAGQIFVDDIRLGK